MPDANEGRRRQAKNEARPARPGEANPWLNAPRNPIRRAGTPRRSGFGWLRRKGKRG